jgi:hypothetical protein
VTNNHLLAAAGTLLWILVPAAPAASVYNFVTVNGPGDNGGGTTVNAISNAGALVGFGMNANDTVLTNFVRNSSGTFATPRSPAFTSAPTACSTGSSPRLQPLRRSPGPQ